MIKNLNLFNTLSNKIEKFVPIKNNKVGMYVCGPTVYDFPHIGNARPLVVFDILYKVLKCKFGQKNVAYIRNITDIDDKIIKSSLEKNIPTQKLTEKITKNFHDDCDYLVCEKPTNEPKATENISLMIEMINKLIKKNFAYINNKHVYFEVKKFKDYGRLSNKNLDELIAGSRVEVSENKKNPEDFVLWKPSKDNEPFWESPWGNEFGAPQFGSFFFMITGFHGLHVSIGVIYLSIIAKRVLNGRYDRLNDYQIVEVAGLYWHFVDLVWVYIFAFFYLW